MDTISGQDARQAAVQTMTDVMVQAGVSREDAEKLAPFVVNEADKNR